MEQRNAKSTVSAMGTQSEEEFLQLLVSGQDILMGFFLVSITPYVEQQALWEQISSPTDGWQAMGAGPWVSAYTPWATTVSGYRCPSDPAVSVTGLGLTNYGINQVGDAASYGDVGMWEWNAASGPAWINNFDQGRRGNACTRGFVVVRRKMKFRDCLDGLSNTIACGEMACDLGDRDSRTHSNESNGTGAVGGVRANAYGCDDDLDPLRPRFWAPTVPATKVTTNTLTRRGSRWAHSGPVFSGVSFMNGPNRPICLASNFESGGHVSPSSRHQGGVHVMMGDGAVKFITDSIDTGNRDSKAVFPGTGPTDGLAAGIPSPYGLFGALGTRASSEGISTEF